jgi:hypothetical protein
MTLDALMVVKLALMPLLIAGVSLASQRFGPVIGGMLSGFPIVAGPIFVFVTLERGVEFGRGVAVATLAAMLSFGLAILTFAWAARRWPPYLVLPAGWAAFAAGTALLAWWRPSPAVAIAIAFTVPLVLPRLLPSPVAVALRQPLPRSELVARMVAATLMVLALTEIAGYLGPKLSGLLTPFPTVASVLGAFTWRLAGPEAMLQLLRGIVLGTIGLAAFFAVALALLEPLGLLAATLLAVLVGGIAQVALYRWRTRFSAP